MARNRKLFYYRGDLYELISEDGCIESLTYINKDYREDLSINDLSPDLYNEMSNQHIKDDQ